MAIFSLKMGHLASIFVAEEAIEQLVQQFFAEIRDKKRMDMQAGSGQVFTDNICHKADL